MALENPAHSHLIDRANIFMALKSHPAFNELYRLSQSLVDDATRIARDFGGWDKDQILCLQQRAKASAEHHERLFGTMDEAIHEGIMAASEHQDEIVHAANENSIESDNLRAAVMNKMDREEVRVAGSY